MFASSRSVNSVCEPLETRRLFSSVALLHQELHRPPVAIGDLNGDGLADQTIAVNETTQNAGGRSTKPGIDIYLNDGAGEMKFYVRVLPDYDADSSVPVALVIGDLTGDGVPDIAMKLFSVTGQPTPVGESSGTYELVLFEGIPGERDGFTGKFTQRKSFVLPHVLETSGRSRWNSDPYAEDAARSLAVGDVNGDGINDLVSWVGDSVVSVVMSKDGTRTMGEGEPWIGDISAAGRPVTTAGLADLDGDGRAELVGFEERSATIVAASWQGESFKNRPNISFDPRGTGGRDKIRNILIGDFDGDGASDDLCVLTNQEAVIGINDTKPDASGRPPTILLTWGTGLALKGNVKWVDVSHGDVDGDGIDELFTVTSHNGHVTVLK